MNTTLTVLPEFADFPKNYRDLCFEIYLPKPVHTRADARDAGRILTLLAGKKMNRDQRDYFEAIGTHLERYETENLPPSVVVSPTGMLREMMEIHGITQAELGVIIGASESTMSKILSGDRKLKIEEAKIFAHHFRLKVDAFA